MALQTHDHEGETGTDLETTGPQVPTSWRARHGLKLLGAVLGAMFALVVIAQVAC